MAQKPALKRTWSVRMITQLYKDDRLLRIPISCARACTVASEVFTEAQSFADCKLHIRTRLLASAFSNFWNIITASGSCDL
jgi:hypothetical protein